MHELQMYRCHELRGENYGSACTIRQPRWHTRSFTMTSQMLRQRLGRCTQQGPWRRSGRPYSCARDMQNIVGRFARTQS